MPVPNGIGRPAIFIDDCIVNATAILTLLQLRHHMNSEEAFSAAFAHVIGTRSGMGAGVSDAGELQGAYNFQTRREFASTDRAVNNKVLRLLQMVSRGFFRR
jgi:hypothetical protein